jgi:hypothetical protein
MGLAAFLASPTVRRLFVFVLTSAAVALNHRLNLGMDVTEIGSLVALAVAYLAQSAATDRARIQAEAEAAAAAAAGAVRTVQDAAAVLGQSRGSGAEGGQR